MLAERRLDCDILVIGGGSAGSMAAITAKEVNSSLKVVVFEKGDIKYSGSIARGMDALNVVAVPGIATPELYVEAVTEAHSGLVDARPAYLLAKRSYELLQKLESWGVYFPRDKEGNYQVLPHHPRGRFLVVMQEPNLKVMLAERLTRMGCLPVNRTAGVRLLKEGKRIVGAIGLNIRTGEMVVCRAKAVIITTGGTARFGLPNTGSLYGTYDFSGNTGDGYCLGYEAGAELTGFEYTLSYPIIRDLGAPLLSITLPRGAHVLDAFGELVPTTNIIEDMTQAIEKGRGPLSVSLRHLPEEKIREIEDIIFSTERPVEQRFFQGRGVDFRKRDIELNPTECFLCAGHGAAGLVVNEKAETRVPGLYAAGDSASVPRQYLSGAFVYGGVAAESAAAYVERQPQAEIDEAQVEAVRRQRAELLAQDKGTVSLDDFEYKVRRIVNEFVTPPKNGYKLTRALTWMEQFRRELHTLVRVTSYHDLVRAFEVEHIIQSAAFSARASLERKESRWGFFHRRTDYPKTDDANWRKHIILSQGERPEDIRVSFRPVETRL